MVPRDLVSLAASLRRALDDVDAGAVMALHVEIAGREAGRFTVVEIARDSERLQEDLRHYHRTAQIQHHPALVERRQRCRQAAKITVTGVADRGAVRRRVLVDYLGAQSSVHGTRNAQSIRSQQYG